MLQKIRCWWCGDDPLYVEYHDTEWGVPLYQDRKLFEFLCLEGAQAGLSWITILRKREQYYRAFDGFDAERMAGYGDDKIAGLLNDPGIVRNHLKVNAFISNAKAYLRMQEHGLNFSEYLWGFVDGTPVSNAWTRPEQVPSSTPVSEALSRDLKQRGFTFVGPTICYAFMQATGMVNDHLADCFRSGDNF